MARQFETKKMGPVPVALLILAATLIILVTACLVFVFMPYKRYFPPESPEILAMRKSAENGYYKLSQACRMMKRVEQEISESIDQQRRNEFWDWPGNVHDRGWPEDPEIEGSLLNFLEMAGPAIQAMRDALEAEYLLLPEIGDMSIFWEHHSPARLFWRVLVDEAYWLEMQGEYEESMRNYLDAVRLGVAVGSEGGIISGITGHGIELNALRALNKSLHRYDNPQLLNRAVEELSAIEQSRVPPSRTYEFDYKGDENSWAASFESFTYPLPPNVNPQTTFYARSVRKILRHQKERLDLFRFQRNAPSFYTEFLANVDLPYLEFKRIKFEIPADPFSRVSFPHDIKMRKSFTRRDGFLRGTLISIALHLHYMEEGKFPPTLDALCPEYLEQKPQDPFSGEDFIYETVPDGFLLYGLGEDEDDDGGRPYWINPSKSASLLDLLDGDIIIHLPEREWKVLETRR